MPSSPALAQLARWRGPAALLAQVRLHPGTTRAAAARRLGISSGSATEITARLREWELLAEEPAPSTGRGRPTTVLTAHPHGPLALVAQIRHEDWRVGTAGVDGRPVVVDGGRHPGRAEETLAAVAEAAAGVVDKFGARVRAAALAVAGTVRDGRLVQASTLSWGPIDLTATIPAGLPLLVGNDATLAGVAESRTGAAAGAATALHLTVEVGIGGTLVLGGRPVGGASGAGGEFGHLPFGDPALACPCGARGCWDMEVDGRALARHLGGPAPADPRTRLRDALDRPDDPAVHDALDRLGNALGAGVAGLINALDPEIITLGGLAAPLRHRTRTAFDDALDAGLMAFRRTTPPALHDAVHGDDGALHGAAAIALDEILCEEGLAAWSSRPHVRSSC